MLQNFVLAAYYGFKYLPENSKSFEHKKLETDVTNASSIPLALFIALRFSTTGIVLIPFMLLSELYPFKSRCFAAGITAATNYIISFCATKTFYDIEKCFSLPSALCFYGVIGAIGYDLFYSYCY